MLYVLGFSFLPLVMVQSEELRWLRNSKGISSSLCRLYFCGYQYMKFYNYITFIYTFMYLECRYQFVIYYC